ncbi:MAG TPA: efflux RND transporter periplasmic adaptor subunit [Mycobacteriales bacterium]|nr:efflux RND transporter periplasmic adaptor subunit [Mycobacteriales bacterium]
MRRVVPRLTRGRVIVGVVVLVVLGGSSALAATAPWNGSSSNATTEIATAQRTTIVQTVSASGTIEPAKQADLDFAVSGRVTHVRVKVGDVVTKGQTLATVGTAALADQRAAAEATVAADADKVAEDSPGSAQQRADEAALSAARSSLRSANLDLADADLKATFGGTVTAVNLSVGQEVSAGGEGDASVASGSGATSAQVAVQSTRSFVVDATVDDTEVSEVKKGQAVAVTPEGATTPVAGTVTSVTTVPTSSSGVVSFPVTIALTGHPQDVYAGSSATLSITTSKAVNVLAIPTLAITYSGSTATVKVDTGSGTQTRTITVGQTYGQQTAVKSGLVAGDKVVITIPTFARIGSTGGTGTFTRGFGGGTFTRGFGSTGGGFPSFGGGG